MFNFTGRFAHFDDHFDDEIANSIAIKVNLLAKI